MSKALSFFAVCVCASFPVAFASAQEPVRLPQFEKRTPVVLAVENVGPAVVSIKTQSKVGRGFHPFRGVFQSWEEDQNAGFADRSVGSGVVIHPDGFVVTNEHVVSGADRIFVSFNDGAAGRTLEAEFLNSDVDNDLAVLKILTKGPYPYARFGDSDALMVGETTIALGCPFGIGASVTTGVISAKNRPVVFKGKEVFRDFLQTSALIHPGNSGGPLLDVNGALIGINVAIDLRGAGIGYAIPVARVREVVTRLADPAIVRRAFLGLDVETASGTVRVVHVDAEGPAGKAGVREGDVIAAVADSEVNARLDYHFALLGQPEDRPVALRLRRGKDEATVNLAFQRTPLSALSRRSFDEFGFSVSDVTPRLAKDFKLEAAEGAVITEILAGGVAQKIDLRAGDVLYQAAGYRLKNADALAEVLRYAARRARSIEVLVLREGKAFKGTMPLP